MAIPGRRGAPEPPAARPPQTQPRRRPVHLCPPSLAGSCGWYPPLRLSGSSNAPHLQNKGVERDGLLNVPAQKLGQIVDLLDRDPNPGEGKFLSQGLELRPHVAIANLAAGFAQYQQIP